VLIDNVPEWLTGEIPAKVVREQVVVTIPQLLRQPCGVRRNQEVVEIPQR
jgi:hypothetical protein